MTTDTVMSTNKNKASIFTLTTASPDLWTIPIPSDFFEFLILS